MCVNCHHYTATNNPTLVEDKLNNKIWIGNLNSRYILLADDALTANK